MKRELALNDDPIRNRGDERFTRLVRGVGREVPHGVGVAGRPRERRADLSSRALRGNNELHVKETNCRNYFKLELVCSPALRVLSGPASASESLPLARSCAATTAGSRSKTPARTFHVRSSLFMRRFKNFPDLSSTGLTFGNVRTGA